MKTPSLQASVWAPNRAVLAAAMAIILVVLAPFASALEIHHALAAADDDGHEHSVSDLCQWVQHHTGSSVLAIVPTLRSSPVCIVHEFPRPALLVSARLISHGHSRAPPTA
ncbi:MAG: hypothetical protein H0W13_09185 [Nitrospirales bacterium]|nr:hypothetical protein [Nitrospirales bacterium]